MSHTDDTYGEHGCQERHPCSPLVLVAREHGWQTHVVCIEP